MSNRSITLNDRLYDYLLNVSLSETEVQRSLRLETARLSSGVMQIAPEQGQFMALLIQLMQAKRVLEIGTFTGYSALCMAMAMPEEGKLIACDHDRRWLEMAQRHWEQAGVLRKIEFKFGKALQSLEEIRKESGADSFDFAFIDADKGNYEAYYEHCVFLVRVGGLIVIDNVLWGGAVVDPADQETATQAIRRFNLKLKSDPRIKLSLVPIGDGLSLALKLPVNRL